MRIKDDCVTGAHLVTGLAHTEFDLTFKHHSDRYGVDLMLGYHDILVKSKEVSLAMISAGNLHKFFSLMAVLDLISQAHRCVVFNITYSIHNSID